jgi:hypothetical protein
MLLDKNLPLLAVALGISGIYLLSKPKMAFSAMSSRSSPDSTTEFENKEAEIIGDYLAHGVGGTTFRLPQSGDVLKIVSLENDGYDLEGQPNREQAEFIEDLWMQKLDGQNPFSSDFVEIKHYNRGYAGQKMVELVNSEDNYHPLKMGEKIAYWVMEYVPTIGNGEMTDARIRGAKMRLEEWADQKGYTLDDMHPANFGEREDGSFVLFDGWPTKIEQ